MKCKTIEQKKMRNNGDAPRQGHIQRKKTWTTIARTKNDAKETSENRNKKLPKMKHKQTKTNKQIDLNDCTTHTKPLNRYNTEEETKLTHNSQ